jgi:DNA polymerase epsilon subunit 2
LLAQGHLSPLPLPHAPIHWNLDHTMRLYPIPDVLIQANCSESFSFTLHDCACLSPGSFSVASRWEFYVYYPATRTCELSNIR